MYNGEENLTYVKKSKVQYRNSAANHSPFQTKLVFLQKEKKVLFP